MKPDITEVLIPSSKSEGKTATHIITHLPPLTTTMSPHRTSCCSFSNWFIGFMMFFTVTATILTTGVIIRYEGKLSDYETRIGLLEDELTFFFESFETFKGNGGTESGDDDDEISFDDIGENEPDNDVENENESLENLNNESFGYLSPQINVLNEDSATVEEVDQTQPTTEEDGTRIIFGEMKETDNHRMPWEQKPTGTLFRRKRQANFNQRSTSVSDDGVPIRTGSYGDSGNRNHPTVGPTDSEGLRLYESLWATSGRGEPKSDQFEESHGTNVKAYHRQSAAWTSREERASQRGSGGGLQLRSGTYGSDTSLADDQVYPRSGNTRRHIDTHDNHSTRQQYSSGTGAGSTVTHRASYVSSGSQGTAQPNTISRSSRTSNDQLYERNPRTREYQYPPLQRLGRGEGEVIARVHQDSAMDRQAQGQTQRPRPTEPTQPDHVLAEATHGDTTSSFAESRRYKGGYSRTGDTEITSGRQQSGSGTGRSRQRNNRGQLTEAESGEFSFVKAEAWAEGPKTYAAHYVGDVSNYTMAHRHYEGNGRLKNADGFFATWKPSDWMAGNQATKEAFSLSATGVLTVKKEGIYYIYAQIHYLDEHDINGFIVQVNTTPFLQCTTMTETRSTTSKSNTCFTAGVTSLKENDRIVLKDIETNRYSIFKAEKSFFGLMRIGNTAGR